MIIVWSPRAHMSISTNFQRKIAEPEISYGRALYLFCIIIFFFCIFFIYW